jgi:hypothetical protein
MPFGVSSPGRDNAKRVGFGSSGKLARRFRSQVDEPRKPRACLSSRSRRNLALFRHYRPIYTLLTAFTSLQTALSGGLSAKSAPKSEAEIFLPITP